MTMIYFIGWNLGYSPAWKWSISWWTVGASPAWLWSIFLSGLWVLPQRDRDLFSWWTMCPSLAWPWSVFSGGHLAWPWGDHEPVFLCGLWGLPQCDSEFHFMGGLCFFKHECPKYACVSLHYVTISFPNMIVRPLSAWMYWVWLCLLNKKSGSVCLCFNPLKISLKVCKLFVNIDLSLRWQDQIWNIWV